MQQAGIGIQHDKQLHLGGWIIKLLEIGNDAMSISQRPKFISVVLSTYNAPLWLEKSLWGYACQRHRDFEVVIADDGSNSDTADLIHRVRRQTGLAVTEPSLELEVGVEGREQGVVLAGPVAIDGVFVLVQGGLADRGHGLDPREQVLAEAGEQREQALVDGRATGVIDDRKVPHHIRMRDGDVFALAGLWDRWQGDGESLESCSILMACCSWGVMMSCWVNNGFS